MCPSLLGSMRSLGRSLPTLRRAISGGWWGLRTDRGKSGTSRWLADGDPKCTPFSQHAVVRKERHGTDMRGARNRENWSARVVFGFAIEKHSGPQRRSPWRKVQTEKVLTKPSPQITLEVGGTVRGQAACGTLGASLMGTGKAGLGLLAQPKGGLSYAIPKSESCHLKGAWSCSPGQPCEKNVDP